MQLLMIHFNYLSFQALQHALPFNVINVVKLTVTWGLGYTSGSEWAKARQLSAYYRIGNNSVLHKEFGMTFKITVITVEIIDWTCKRQCSLVFSNVKLLTNFRQ